jgi:mRNA-degrading endonuclease RelE of RelBE toxin-antitoxin system
LRPFRSCARRLALNLTGLRQRLVYCPFLSDRYEIAVPYHVAMSTAVIIQDSFLACAYELPKEIAKKVFKTMRALVANPRSGGLQIEKLSGRSKGLWSARVDKDYRIIFNWSSDGVPVILYVAKHDDAYDYSDATARAGAGLGLVPAPGVEAPLDMVAPVAVAKAIVEVVVHPDKPARVCTEIDRLEPLVSTRKYLPLARVLMNSTTRHVELPFSEIERIIGFSLPASARKYPAWWANESSGSHVQAHAWVGIGWRVVTLRLDREQVVFER